MINHFFCLFDVLHVIYVKIVIENGLIECYVWFPLNQNQITEMIF